MTEAGQGKGLLKRVIVILIIVVSIGMLGVITYSYFFYKQPTTPAGLLRGETVRNTNSLTLWTSRGVFIDKDQELNPEVAAPVPGFRAPDFALADLEGREVRLSDLRGRPVLLNFWASWCPPCRKEMPDLQAFHQAYGDRITLIGVDWGESPADAQAFLDDFAISYPNLLDSDGKVFVQYGMTGIPTTFFIDEAGIIRGVWNGAMDFEDMVAAFQKTTRALESESR
ncbi:MAG: TlpA family protein disulfide reductase [Candidatus Bipolaricaulia bacterium]